LIRWSGHCSTSGVTRPMDENAPSPQPIHRLEYAAPARAPPWYWLFMLIATGVAVGVLLLGIVLYLIHPPAAPPATQPGSLTIQTPQP